MTTLLEVADALYALPLGEFTPARDARAKELKAEGGDAAEVARQVKALRKPATAAWVVNLLVRVEAEQVGQVLAVGDALREAQRSMSADELRALTRQRRQVTAAVTQQARRTARERGLKVTEAVATQVEATLTAAMVDEQCAAAVRSGLLVAPLASTGLEDVDVAGALAAPEALGFTATARAGDGEDAEGEREGAERHGLHVVPDPDADLKAREAAASALADAEDALTEADEAHRAAQVDVDELEARTLQLGSEIEELRRRLSDLEATAEEADDELDDAVEVRDETAGTREQATTERDAARAALDALGG